MFTAYRSNSKGSIMSIFRRSARQSILDKDYVCDAQKIHAEGALDASRILQFITAVFMVVIGSIVLKQYMTDTLSKNNLWMMVPLFASSMGFNFATGRVRYHSGVLTRYFSRITREELEEKSETRTRR